MVTKHSSNIFKNSKKTHMNYMAIGLRKSKRGMESGTKNNLYEHECCGQKFSKRHCPSCGLEGI